MASIIEMPKLSDTMTVGTLVSWLKKEGEKVANGDMIAEIETDKATMELECFDDGVLLKQMVKAGEQVSVGTPICAVGEKGEKVDDLPDSKKSSKDGGESKKESKGDPKEAKSSGKKEEPEKKDRESSDEKKDEAKKPSEGHEREEDAGADESAPAPSETSGGRIKISPLARKVAKQKGISVEGIQGSGPGGRIVKADVLAAAESGGKSAKPASGAPAKSAPSPDLYSGGDIAEEKTIQLSNMRETIARRLLESKTQIPHFYLEMEIDAAPLLALRESVNAALADVPPEQGGAKLSVNDFVLKACAEALRRVPAVNCSWKDGSIQQHPSAHVSFAVAIDEGLITPVIRDAQNKTVRRISAEVKELAGKAKNKKLKPNEFTGGTFCVSNLGMFGVDRFNAIINPPNAAILAVGAARKLPVVGADNSITVGHRMSLVLSCDHRVVDGAVGSTFLATLRTLLEKPASMLV